MKPNRWPALVPALLLALFLFLAAGGLAGAEPLTLEAAVVQAQKSNVDYQNALLALDRAAAALPSPVNWKNVSVSATQKQTSGSGTEGQPGYQPAASTTNLGLNLPLFDQLGASASVDQDGNAQVGLTANPLSHSDSAVQSRISYEKAVLAAAQARTSLETAVRKAYLAQVAAQAQRDLQVRKTALKETAYQDAKARYERGQVTLAEVRTALQDWIGARTSLTAAERNVVKAQADLAARLQTGAVETAGLDASVLEGLVEALGPVDAAIRGTSAAVKAQALEVEAQQAKADAVWLFDPNLSVQASASLPAEGPVTWSGAVTLTLALGDWQQADKALAERSAALALQGLEVQKTAARSAEVQALLAVQSATDTVETRTLALAQARELQTETRLLARSGKATDLEVEDADVGVTSAELDLFTAWADLYGARLDLESARS